MFGRVTAKESKSTPIEGVLSVGVENWEKLRRILSVRYDKDIDDKEVMYYVLNQGNLLKGNCKYGVVFDIDGENVILEV